MKANIKGFFFEWKSSRVSHHESVCVLWKSLSSKHYGIRAKIGTIAGVSPLIELHGISKTACSQL
jgi:hypothetical protein